MATGALIPIRLDSARLPQKALLDIAGVPAVNRLITQIAASGCVPRDRIVICTTERVQDDALAIAAEHAGVRVFRGSTDDLIDRLYRAAIACGFETVLQVDGDDICADPAYMRACVDMVTQGAAQVVCCPDGLPLGAASKAFRADCLEAIFTAYVPGRNDTGFAYYLTRSGMFSVGTVGLLQQQHVMPDLRLTLDYTEDLELFRAIYGELRGARDEAVAIEDICALARARTELRQINAGLDEGYWERTRELLVQNPLRLRRGDATIELDVE